MIVELETRFSEDHKGLKAAQKLVPVHLNGKSDWCDLHLLRQVYNLCRERRSSPMEEELRFGRDAEQTRDGNLRTKIS